MKYLASFSIILLIVLSCTKKVIPSASVPVVEAKSSPVVTAVPSTPSILESTAAGMTIYQAKCGRCHDLPVPSSYSLKKWDHIMDEMAPKAKLNDEQKANVLMYVQANAKK